MASYLLKIKRWLGRGLMVAIIGLVISFLPIIANVLFENEIENLLYILNINIRTIMFFVLDRPCLMPLFVLAAYFLWAFYMVIIEHNWDDVEFSAWNPALAFTKNGKSERIKGGIKIVNNKDDVLEICEVELLKYESQHEKQNFITKSSKVMSAFFQDSSFPAGLFWWTDKGIYDESIDIWCRKEAYLVLVLFDDKPDVIVLGEKDPEYMKYTLLTKKTRHQGLLDDDTFLNLRLSAKIGGKSLLPKKIGVKIDITNNNPIREVIEIND